MTIQPSQLNGAQAIFALANMEQATNTAEARVENATNQVLNQYQAALTQSENNNQALAGRLSQAIERRSSCKQS